MEKKINKKIVFVVEERETDTNEFLGECVYETLEQARDRFNNCKENGRNTKSFKGVTLILIKQVLVGEENYCGSMFDTIIEEEFIDSYSF